MRRSHEYPERHEQPIAQLRSTETMLLLIGAKTNHSAMLKSCERQARQTDLDWFSTISSKRISLFDSPWVVSENR